jgi:hypothetical protein
MFHLTLASTPQLIPVPVSDRTGIPPKAERPKLTLFGETIGGIGNPLRRQWRKRRFRRHAEKLK